MITSFIKQQIVYLKRFIAKPDDKRTDLSGVNKYGFFIFIVVLDLAIAGLLTLVLQLALKLIFIDVESNIINQIIKSSPPGFVILITVIFAPLIEEFIFRFFLRYDKMFPLMIYRNLKIKIGISKKIVSTDVRRIWDRYFPILFYIPLIIFSLLHILNYQLTATVVLFMPLLVLPQLFAGIFFGYIRVRLNFLSAVLMHALHNLLFVGFMLFQMYSSGYYDKVHIGEIHKIETENYSMIIEEVVYSPTDDSRFEVYAGMIKFKAVNANVEELNSTFKDDFIRDSTSEVNNTYNLIDKNMMNRIGNKKYNIDYNPKKEYEHHLDTIVKLLNQTINRDSKPMTKFSYMKIF